MNIRTIPFAAILSAAFSLQLGAIEYPGSAPGEAQGSVREHLAVLSTAAIRGEWTIDGGKLGTLAVTNRHSNQTLRVGSGALPKVVLGDGRTIDLANSAPASLVLDGLSLRAEFRDEQSGLAMSWSASLEDDSNAIIQELELTATNDTRIKELVFLDAPLDGARQVGEVDGSVVVCGDLFMAVEHPLAKNQVDEAGRARCLLPRGNVLKAGRTWAFTSVFGAVPQGQLRRGFLYYLERRRAQPYRPFLHYNNWYDVVLSRRKNRITEPESLAAVDYFGRELVKKRGVPFDAFVWDDGWDDFNTLWDFHDGFPEGFKNLNAVASKFGAAQGVWLSPRGGYASAQAKRLAYGKSQGYETNRQGYSMAGDKYRRAYLDVCLKMIREQGVVFFKFDGMGGGGHDVTGADGLPDDIDGILEVSKALRREKPDVFISATVGTWASPFWTLYSDCIWRQGGDTGMFGPGNTRQQWITYRDMFCHDRVVQAGPLYPLNSLMLHGVCIGKRPGRAPSGLAFTEKSVADEIWSFFGSGTNLQELYVSPDVMSETMLDELAAAAKWSRANSDVLVDTHWVGGNPGKGEVYGWASWRPGKGILVLRNPSEETKEFVTTLAQALEFPKGKEEVLTPAPVFPRDDGKLSGKPVQPGDPVRLSLEPFEVVVLEWKPVTPAGD